MNELISIAQAAERGITRLRRPIWANPLDHLTIDIVDGKPGRWVRLHGPLNIVCDGRDPVPIWADQIDCYSEGYVEYTGPLADSPEYQAAAEQLKSTFSGGEHE